jgi:hypothetical protein
MLKFNLVFFLIVVVIYVLFALVNVDFALHALKDALQVFLFKILPVLLFVYFLMFLINLFLEDKQIKNFFSKV